MLENVNKASLYETYGFPFRSCPSLFLLAARLITSVKSQHNPTGDVVDPKRKEIDCILRELGRID